MYVNIDPTRPDEVGPAAQAVAEAFGWTLMAWGPHYVSYSFPDGSQMQLVLPQFTHVFPALALAAHTKLGR